MRPEWFGFVLWIPHALQANLVSANALHPDSPSPTRPRAGRKAPTGLKKSCAIISGMEQQELIEKIKRLPQESVAEVEEFVDALTRREGTLDRKSLHQALTNYASKHAGTDADLDADLEASATDHLLQQNSEQ